MKLAKIIYACDGKKQAKRQIFQACRYKQGLGLASKMICAHISRENAMDRIDNKELVDIDTDYMGYFF